MKKPIYFFQFLTLFLFLIFTLNTIAQTPQYYNLTNGNSSNSFPFNMAAGKETQYLFLPGDFSQPSPAPAGNITKVYIYMSGTSSGTYTTLVVKMGQSSITTLPPSIVTGLTTVDSVASITLSSTTNSWMSITLQTPFAYNPAQSLILDIYQCATTASGATVWNTMLSGARRNYITPSSCVFTYSGQDASTLNCGLDISPASSNSYFFSQWCPAAQFPVIPSATGGGASDIIGDTIYHAVGSVDFVTASALVYKYSITGNTWTAAASLPSAHISGTLTACGGNLYWIGGGTTPGTATTDVYKYSPTTGQWTTMAPLTTAKSGHSAFNWGDSVIIVAGGPWAAPDANVYCYRPASNTWATCTSFSGGSTCRSQGCGIFGNKIYMVDGYGAAGFLSQLVIGTIGSNAQTITWAAGTAPPTWALSRVGATAVRGKLYMIGGNNPNGTSNDSSFVFDINSNTWSPFHSQKPTAVHNINNCVVTWIRSDTVRIAVCGGSNNSTISNVFQVIGCGPIIVGVPKVTTIPNIYSLSQNFPNPFNPTTVIKYTLSKASNVELKVYDLLGREVAILVNESKHAGTYSVQFDGTNFASGTYFYKLTAGNFTSTKKMLLIK